MALQYDPKAQCPVLQCVTNKVVGIIIIYFFYMGLDMCVMLIPLCVFVLGSVLPGVARRLGFGTMRRGGRQAEGMDTQRD